MNPLDQRKVRVDAWIGDAVLLLFARQAIVERTGVIDGEGCIRMTSNQFLSTFGEPTSVEAQIGRIYKAEGLQAAFRYIEVNFLPTFEKQELNRVKGLERARAR